MKNFYILLFAAITFTINAQVYPVNFEPGGNGADWTWTVFENDTNPPLEIVPNPDTSGINTSSTVAKFTALVGGMPFAGCETMHGSDVGTFTLGPDNAYVAIMVYKSVISDVGFKFATPEGASTGEIKISNTLIDQWERLVFDFTGIIGEPSSNGIDQIIVFPDFQNRTTDNVIYFDNIIFGDSSLLNNADLNAPSVSLWPNPASDQLQISSSTVIEEVIVHNQLGQQVQRLAPKTDTTVLDVSQLSQGMYFVTLLSDGFKTVEKLLVK